MTKPSLAIRALSKWESAHPDYHRTLRGLLSVGAFVVAAKCVGMAKEIAVAARYGVSGIVDAYLLALTVSTWAPSVMISVGAAVLVPRLARLQSGARARAKFLAELNATAVILGTGLLMLTIFAAPWLVPWLSSGLSPASQAATLTMVLRMSPMALLVIGAGLLAIRLQASERHSYALAEAGPALGILLLVLLMPLGSGWRPLVWGTLLGAVLQIGWSGFTARRADGRLEGMSFGLSSPEWRGVYSALGVMTAGSLIASLVTPVDQMFAARLGDGAVAILGYANRLVALVTGLGAVTLARALLPVFSGAAVADQISRGYRQAKRWTWISFACGLVAIAVGWPSAPWIVGIVFERGSFDAGNTKQVVEVLRAFLFHLPFYFGGVVLVQWMLALGLFRRLLYVAMAAIVVKVVLNAALAGPFGIAGIGWSTGGAYAVSFLMQLALIRPGSR